MMQFQQRRHHQSFSELQNGFVAPGNWQCVEFVRRWMLLRKGMTFGDISNAAQMWVELKAVKCVRDDRTFSIKAFPNGNAVPPKAESLLIYACCGGNPFGHVAVIIEVLPQCIRVLEQNEDLYKYPGNFAREIPLKQIGGKFYVQDEDEILGWLTVDDRATENLHTEIKLKVQPNRWMRRFKLPVGEDSLEPAWLSRDDPIEDVFLDTWSADIVRKGDRSLTYYEFSQALASGMQSAANELHQMFVQATEKVLNDDKLLSKFSIPSVFWDAIKRSWNKDRAVTLTGRFDFAFDGTSLKIFEYNADSASTLFECAVVQSKWANAVGLGNRGISSGADVHSRLVETWKQMTSQGLRGVVHLMIDTEEVEEEYTALYVGKTANEAGLQTKLCRGLQGLVWQDGKVVDSEGIPVSSVWKTWSWETVFADYLDAEDERKGMHEEDWKKNGTQPRLSDVLLDPRVSVMEPLWKTVTSNKALLPILWSMFPDHPNLLRSEWELSESLRKSGFVAKPIVGRCGRNVTVVNPSGCTLEESTGEFNERLTIYQELYSLPCYDGYYPIIGAWIIGETMAGFGVREDKSRITGVDSPCSACRVI